MILRLSKSAKRDLSGISVYTQKTWGIEKEEQYLNALFDRFEQITSDSSRWKFRDELYPGSQSVSVGKHIIFFKVDGEVIQVARILHQKMDFARHLDPTDFSEDS